MPFATASVVTPSVCRALVTAAVVLVLCAESIGAATIVRVRAGDNLQKAIDTAPAGAVIVLPAGAAFTGNFVLPRHGSTEWKTLTTEGSAGEKRIGPEDSGKLAVLRSPSNQPALTTAPGARFWRVVGLEIAPNTDASGTSIEIGSGVATSLDELASDIVLDRLLVRGDPQKGQKRGVALHGRGLTLTRSYVSDFKRDGQDAQAVYINNGPGPYVITDNYLEGSGENILIGGDTPRIAGLVPADITIESNVIAKPLTWQGQPWDVKNLLEMKRARRVMIRNNRFSGNWVAAQAGYAILFTPRNQNGKAPWTVVEDVRFEGNVVSDVSSAINVTGDDSEHPSQRTNRIVIRDNVVATDAKRFGGDGRFMLIGRAPQQLTIEGNTCICDGSSWIYTYKGGTTAKSEGLVVRGNVARHNKYGFLGDGAAPGASTLAAYYPDAIFEGNVLGGGSAREYPKNNQFPSADALRSRLEQALQRLDTLSGRR